MRKDLLRDLFIYLLIALHPRDHGEPNQDEPRCLLKHNFIECVLSASEMNGVYRKIKLGGAGNV